LSNLPRLHWTTLGEPTLGMEHRWASHWDYTLDSNKADPALPPKDAELWAISAGAVEPPPALVRVSGEVGAMPILLLRKPDAGPLSPESLLAWSELGSARWGEISEQPPLPGMRPSLQIEPPMTGGQALGVGFVIVSEAMKNVLAKAKAAAATKATVLLTGESGTGKEVVSKAIHRMSAEADGPFVAVHCGAIPENLIESELFGYAKGAFTDARKDTPGKFREAHEGTIFLDEVATMPMAAQVRLLRVLQEREVQPLGGGGAVKVDVRVIVATNQDLWKKVQEGSFREDLFYRLDVVPISLPPLRERREEIPALAQNFLIRKAREYNLYPKVLHPSVDARLCAQPWPGNVRQLENAIERSIVLAGSKPVLTREDFEFLMERVPEEEREAVASRERDGIDSSLPPPPIFVEPLPTNIGERFELPPDGLDLNQAVSEFEKNAILQALSVTRGNKKRAAELVGLKRTTFLEKMKRLEIQDDDPAPDAE